MRCSSGTTCAIAPRSRPRPTHGSRWRRWRRRPNGSCSGRWSRRLRGAGRRSSRASSSRSISCQTGGWCSGVGLGLDTSGEEFARSARSPTYGGARRPSTRGSSCSPRCCPARRSSTAARTSSPSGVQFRPIPVRGHLPIWVAAVWPNPRPLQPGRTLRRGLRHRGDSARSAAGRRSRLQPNAPRGLERLDVVVKRWSDADAEEWARAGATWLLTRFDQFTVDADVVRRVIAPAHPANPPVECDEIRVVGPVEGRITSHSTGVAQT